MEGKLAFSLVVALLVLLFGAAFGPPPIPPPLNAPKLLDISEASGALDTGVMEDAHVSAVIVRASHGATADTQAAANVAQLEAAEIPVAALYHDYAPGIGWQAQYDALAAVMNATGIPRGAVRLGGGLTAADAPGVRSFLLALAAEFPLPMTYRHMIQTDAAAWQALGSPAWGAGYELWIVEPGIVTPAPGVPAPWKGWRLWQYTTAADGPSNGVGASTVAISRFNGTSTQFAGWVNLARMQGGSVGR